MCDDLWILSLIGLDHSVISLKKKVRAYFRRHLRKTSRVRIPLVVKSPLKEASASGECVGVTRSNYSPVAT